jgi:hypothetical protein
MSTKDSVITKLASELISVPENYEDWKSRADAYSSECDKVEEEMYNKGRGLRSEFASAAIKHNIGKRIRYRAVGSLTLGKEGVIVGAFMTMAYNNPPTDGVVLLVRPDTPDNFTGLYRGFEHLGPLDDVFPWAEVEIL